MLASADADTNDKRAPKRRSKCCSVHDDDLDDSDDSFGSLACGFLLLLYYKPCLYGTGNVYVDICILKLISPSLAVRDTVCAFSLPSLLPSSISSLF